MMNNFFRGIKGINRQRLGRAAEKTAAQYLRRQGLTMVEHNYHCRFGEIDLIMRDGLTWVFIEVRCRAENATVNPYESINAAKIAKIQKTARHYTMRFAEMPDCRFDVIAITHNRDKIGYTIDWIQNAF